MSNQENYLDEKNKGSAQKKKKKKGMVIEGYQVEGISIADQETCIVLPSLRLAFDIGRCPQSAISQDFIFISHARMDHIGGLSMYVANRGLNRMEPPTVVVPSCVKETVEKVLEVHRKLYGLELYCNIVGLDVGEELSVGRNIKVKAFRTYHTIQSQGYLVYAVKHKLKREYLGLSGTEIKNLKTSGVEITDTITTPEIAFTRDTKSDFITDEANADVLRAKILIVESTFLDNTITIQHARECGHTHLSEIIDSADKFQNKAILLIHFSAQYTVEEIQEAVCRLPPPLTGRVFALTEGILSGQNQSEDGYQKVNFDVVEGYQVEGISVGGQETCVILPSLSLAFDIGRCPQHAISQDFLFISHAHVDHIGGLPMYVATRGLHRMKPPTIVVPSYVIETVEESLEVQRKLVGSELNCNIVGLDVGEELSVGRNIKVKAFRTYHRIQSQGYLVYAVKHKLKQEYLDRSKNLKTLGVEIMDTITTPEIAFTGDTKSDFITDEANAEVLRAKILIVESTFLDNTITIQHAREYGHIHLSEIIDSADKFQNKAILLIHFSARYTVEEIQGAVCRLPPPLTGRVFALTEGI